VIARRSSQDPALHPTGLTREIASGADATRQALLVTGARAIKRRDLLGALINQYDSVATLSVGVSVPLRLHTPAPRHDNKTCDRRVASQITLRVICPRHSPELDDVASLVRSRVQETHFDPEICGRRVLQR
jgi:hypothetical protein